jgi:hypothetical protein
MTQTVYAHINKKNKKKKSHETFQEQRAKLDLLFLIHRLRFQHELSFLMTTIHTPDGKKGTGCFAL